MSESWRDRVLPASFRGIQFSLDAARRESAPLRSREVFPHRQTAPASVKVESLGAGPRTHTFDAYVYGEDYDRRLADLEEALEDSSPGMLVHPYRGSMLVVPVGKLTTTHRRAKAGYAIVRFAVEETEDDGIMVLDAMEIDAATSALADAGAAMIDAGAIASAPASVLSSILSTYEDVVGALRDAYGYVARAVGYVDQVQSELARITSTVGRLADSPALALAELGEAFGAVMTTVREIEAAPGRLADGVIAAIRVIGDQILDDEQSRPSQRADEADLRRRVSVAVWTAAMAGVIDAAGGAPYGSRSAALGARTSILDECMRLEDFGAGDGTADSAGLYGALSDARARFAARMDATARRLPEVREYVVASAIPAIALAWQLYGDPTRAEDIIRRNDIPTPDLIPAGTVLEVLR